MKRLAWLVAAIFWMGVIWWLSDQPNLSSGLASDLWLRKAAHVFEFAFLTFLLIKTFGGGMRGVGLAVIFAISYAVLDEWHQTWVLGRSGNARDVMIDSIGVLITAVLAVTKKRA